MMISIKWKAMRTMKSTSRKNYKLTSLSHSTLEFLSQKIQMWHPERTTMTRTCSALTSRIFVLTILVGTSHFKIVTKNLRVPSKMQVMVPKVMLMSMMKRSTMTNRRTTRSQPIIFRTPLMISSKMRTNQKTWILPLNNIPRKSKESHPRTLMRGRKFWALLRTHKI